MSKVGAASPVSWGVGCQYFVFIYWCCSACVWCCSACVGTRNLFTQLALSTFCERKYKIVGHTTHLEFSSLSRVPPGLALSLRHTLRIARRRGKGGREGEGKEGRVRRKEKSQRVRGERDPGRKGGKKRKKEGKGRKGRAARGPQRKVLMRVTNT